MVDLDDQVVALCREHLPNHHQGSFDDPRLTLLHEDALAYLEKGAEPFDVIIIDVADPLEGGPAYLLYTEEFYRLVRSRLAPGGAHGDASGAGGAHQRDGDVHCYPSHHGQRLRPCVGQPGVHTQLWHDVGVHRGWDCRGAGRRGDGPG